MKPRCSRHLRKVGKFECFEEIRFLNVFTVFLQKRLLYLDYSSVFLPTTNLRLWFTCGLARRFVLVV
jgi:hypothetical protein